MVHSMICMSSQRGNRYWAEFFDTADTSLDPISYIFFQPHNVTNFTKNFFVQSSNFCALHRKKKHFEVRLYSFDYVLFFAKIIIWMENHPINMITFLYIHLAIGNVRYPLGSEFELFSTKSRLIWRRIRLNRKFFTK